MKTLAQLRKAKGGLAGQRWLIYGAPKIGKSTFASQAPGNPLFLDCEYGLGFLDAYVIPCMSWASITETIDTICRGGHDHKTIVIDTVDRFVAMAGEEALTQINAHSKNPVDHISDAAYGKGFGRMREILDAALYKLASSGRLVLLLSHDKTVSKEGEPDKIKPSVARLEQVLGYCDVIGHVELGEKDQRVIRFRATSSVTAGARGRAGIPMLPPVLPLSWDAIRAHLDRADKLEQPSDKTPDTRSANADADAITRPDPTPTKVNTP